MIVVLDWLQYFAETVGHVVANRWLVFPTILASLVGMVAVALTGMPLFALLAGFGGVEPLTMGLVPVVLILPILGLAAAALLISVWSRSTVDAVVPGLATQWIYGTDNDRKTPMVQYFSFTAPIGQTECGRMVFSDLHVSTGSGDSSIAERAERVIRLCRLQVARNLAAASLSYGEEKMLGVAMAMMCEPQHRWSRPVSWR